MKDVQKDRVLYILYVPLKTEYDILNSVEFKKIQRQSSDSWLSPMHSSLNLEMLDEAVDKVGIQQVFEQEHRRRIGSLTRIWVAGRGATLFARELIRTAMSPDYGIPVDDHTPAKSFLGRYIRMFKHASAREAYLQGEKRGIMFPG